MCTHTQYNDKNSPVYFMPGDEFHNKNYKIVNERYQILKMIISRCLYITRWYDNDCTLKKMPKANSKIEGSV